MRQFWGDDFQIYPTRLSCLAFTILQRVVLREWMSLDVVNDAFRGHIRAVVRLQWRRASPIERPDGRVAEWLKALVLKTSNGASRSWVRIPPLPPRAARPRVTPTTIPVHSSGRRLTSPNRAFRETARARSTEINLSMSEPAARPCANGRITAVKLFAAQQSAS
jgi:hypothetical protein